MEMCDMNIDEIPEGPLSSHENLNIEQEALESLLNFHGLDDHRNESSNKSFIGRRSPLQIGENFLQSANHLNNIPSPSNLENPLNECEMPSSNSENPLNQWQQPSSNSENPLNECGMPSSNSENPLNERRQPYAEARFRSAEK